MNSRRLGLGVPSRRGWSSGWSSNADYDADNPVWRAWGGNRRSTSGWIADQAGATLRLRDPHGRIEADTVEHGTAIVTYDAPFQRGSVVEVLGTDGTVLQATPL